MRVVNGAHIPGRFLAGTLHSLGFRQSGKPVKEFEPNGNTVTIQPVTCDLKTSAHEWAAQRIFCIDHLAANGFLFGGEDVNSAEVRLYTSAVLSDDRIQLL
jgi:hypothetical protein